MCCLMNTYYMDYVYVLYIIIIIIIIFIYYDYYYYPSRIPGLGCDIHTHARAQDNSYYILVEEMGTVGGL